MLKAGKIFGHFSFTGIFKGIYRKVKYWWKIIEWLTCTCGTKNKEEACFVFSLMLSLLVWFRAISQYCTAHLYCKKKLHNQTKKRSCILIHSLVSINIPGKEVCWSLALESAWQLIFFIASWIIWFANYPLWIGQLKEKKIINEREKNTWKQTWNLLLEYANYDFLTL